MEKERGGKRAGSGRKETGRKTINFRADPEVLELLQSVKNRSDVINKAVIDYFKKARG